MGNAVKQLLEFGPFRVDLDQRLLLRQEQPVPLSPKAFDLLLALASRSGQVVLKDDLMKLLWPDTFVEESNLGQHVFQLRKALGDRTQDHSYIVTIPGRGYRFVQQVRIIAPEDGTEDIVIQSRSRTHLVIDEDEKVSAARSDRPAVFPAFPSPEQLSLPGRVSAGERPRWRSAVVALLGAALGALVVWTFLRTVPTPRVVRTVQVTQFGRAEPFSRVLPDGSRVYFTERLGGIWSLAQISEQGGEPSLIPSSITNIALFDIDRRGSRLIAASQGPVDTSFEPLWVLPTIGGSKRRLGEIQASDAAWAPDGRSFVYCRGGELFVAGEEGQQPRKLFTYKGYILYPRWVPDGRRISFTTRDLATGTVALWEIGSDGGNPHQLSFGWKNPVPHWNGGECCADWSPDGRYFVFRSIRDHVSSYWLMRDKTSWLDKGDSSPVQIYTSPDWISDPRFSADGKKLFFVDYKERRELVRYDTSRKLFVPYLGGIPARHLSFSRDGQWVAYKNESDGTLWRSRADGTQALQLTSPPFEAFHPSWSPDGKKIVYALSRDLYVIPFDGGNPERLTSCSQPSWSPDGRSILCTRWVVPDAGGWLPAIYRVDVNSREVTMVPGSETFEGPQWSPDGRYAAASDRKDEKLMLFDFARQKWSALADGLPYGWGIRWSADSNYVYYQHIYDGEEQPIFRVRVSDRKVEQITTSRQILRADVLSYSMTGLTPDNSPLASLVHRNSDIYALELDLH
ncbi:MAG TPA: winged helix-turn-helix domain-containing protein [Candidatus Sulfotelmatobacter sp.]|nr:winged helix-turn-helix domain-containing protein [Candidatus Sulfotelmatobacter sp.]